MYEEKLDGQNVERVAGVWQTRLARGLLMSASLLIAFQKPFQGTKVSKLINFDFQAAIRVSELAGVGPKTICPYVNTEQTLIKAIFQLDWSLWRRELLSTTCDTMSHVMQHISVQYFFVIWVEKYSTGR